VRTRLLQILAPFLLQVVVDGGLEGGGIDLDATALGFQRLQ